MTEGRPNPKSNVLSKTLLQINLDIVSVTLQLADNPFNTKFHKFLEVSRKSLFYFKWFYFLKGGVHCFSSIYVLFHTIMSLCEKLGKYSLNPCAMCSFIPKYTTKVIKGFLNRFFSFTDFCAFMYLIK